MWRVYGVKRIPVQFSRLSVRLARAKRAVEASGEIRLRSAPPADEGVFPRVSRSFDSSSLTGGSAGLAKSEVHAGSAEGGMVTWLERQDPVIAEPGWSAPHDNIPV